MFEFLKGGESRVIDALVNQSVGGQSVLYRLFIQALKRPDAQVRRLELTYFAAAVMTYVYLRFAEAGKNVEKVLDGFSRDILEKSIPASKEDIEFAVAAGEYRTRYAEYSRLINLLFHPEESSAGNPEVTLTMRLFENVTNTSARGEMVVIAAAGSLIQQFVADHIDFVKTKL